MTNKQIQKRIQEIRDAAYDDEAAHAAEDNLREDFIDYVSTLTEYPKLAKKAKLVLSTKEILFGRWYA